MNPSSPEVTRDIVFDVVIVGAGITGAILAKSLAAKKKRVLVLEAGTADASNFGSYSQLLDNFYTSQAKVPQSPYPDNANAPQPSELDCEQITPPIPDTNGYFIQVGPIPFLSTYTRYLGGTTLHWLGTSLRMLPDDFKMKTLFGQAEDWPVSYDDMMPYYAMAEFEMGVSADVSKQSYLGIHFPPGYVYPMHELPSSWSDKTISKSLDGTTYEVDQESFNLDVINTPASRNSIPNQAYANGKGYTPVGAVGNPSLGQRCMGNTACVPICPIQAKYNALKTLYSADSAYVTLVTQAVASKVEIDPTTKLVTGIRFKYYESATNPNYTEFVAKGKQYALATHAVENAKLLLASGAANSSDQVGRNLMDHTTLLAWGLAPEPLWPYRGPVATAGVEGMRTGKYRKNTASFRIEIGNDGWGWPTNGPITDVIELVDGTPDPATNGSEPIQLPKLWGKALRERLKEQVRRQFRMAFLVEQLPNADNRVTISPDHKDALGNYIPIISYGIDGYTGAGFELGTKVYKQMFEDIGAIDCTVVNSKTDAGYFQYKDAGYTAYGAGHLCGTHRMGSDPKTSVVNPQQRTWDHENLYLVGCGNMVTVATSNPTLTAGALTFMAAENILASLDK